MSRVAEALAAAGVDAAIVTLPATTHTVVDAAAALGCGVHQIVKSLVFVAGDGETPVLVLASGTAPVDVDALARIAGAPLRLATAREVKRLTGFPIGGVAPVGHSPPLRTLLDRRVLQLDTLWVAAGTPNAVVCLSPSQLVAATAASIVDVSLTTA